MATQLIKQRAQIQQAKQKPKKQEPAINKTLEGVLINSHVKDTSKPMNFDEIADTLLITEDTLQIQTSKKEEKESFSVAKTMLPLMAGTIAVFGGAAAISSVLRKKSGKILKSYTDNLPSIARNMNIPEEPQLAMYEVIRNPNPKTIMGAVAVFLFSAMTIGAKNFVDGAKEIWIKKQEADIERDLQENLIDVEAKAFSGKLNTVNNMLVEKVNYFKNIFEKDKTENSSLKAEILFKQHFTFKGKQNTEQTQKQDANEITKKENNKKLLYAISAVGFVGLCAILGKITFSNIKKACGKMDKIARNKVEQGLKNKSIFANASSGLSGDPGLISYYSYLNEPRGHLYNWVINPENKFLKYIFLSFTSIGAIGYTFKQTMDAIRAVAVAKENSKTELDLKKRLVEVEVENFKKKKESAIQPLMNDFDKKLMGNEKTKEEMKQIAENILCEIKNGPPYVYS